jgi:hypothetical protein
MALHPDFPVVEGTIELTEEWRVTLPGKFNRRIEDGNLVLWRPGITLWIAIWSNDHNETPEQRLHWISEDNNPDAYDRLTETGEGEIRFSYRLAEDSDDDRQPAFYCFAIGQNGHVQMAIYFDDAEDLDTAKQIWRSLRENLP